VRVPTWCDSRGDQSFDASGPPHVEAPLDGQEGVLTSAQAVEAFGRPAVRAALAGGRWRRLCHGVVVAHNGPLTPSQALWAAVLAAGSAAVVGGLTAAQEAGLRLGARRLIHLQVPAHQRYSDRPVRLPPDVPPVVVHRTERLPRHHVRLARPMRTTTSRSLVDAAGWAASDDQARTILAAACQQRLVRPAEVLDAVAELPRARRRALVIETLRDIAGGADALGEIDLVRLCRQFGLPGPEMQQGRHDASGRLRYLDAYWSRWHLHVEVDGAHHMNPAHWESDMVRQNDIWIAGDRILRFSAWQVRHRPGQVADQLRSALRAAGWPS
jgi:hypothetical protein